MNDHTVLENYVKMFSKSKDESEVAPAGLKELLIISYRLSMCVEDGNGFCPQLFNTVDAVVTSCVSTFENDDFELKRARMMILN